MLIPPLYPAVAYRGRFAPSPSGPLHLGSLLTAVGSWLDARAAGGEWLLRIEDIDPPREQPGAAALIQQQLYDHGLHWDRDILWQSQRSTAYQQVLAQLQQLKLAYCCHCSRKQIKEQGGHQGPWCRRQQHQPPGAWRFANLQAQLQFADLRLGQVAVPAAIAAEDVVLQRSDGLWGYPLAVVVDDLAQGISHVVRGADLLQATAPQLALMSALGATPPHYLHLPLVVAHPGFKLSKQNHAPAIDGRTAVANLRQALSLLGLPPPATLVGSDCHSLLHWALAHYQRQRLPSQQELPAASG